MKEKAVVRQRLTVGGLPETPVVRKVMVQAACFAVGFACSRVTVLGRHAPFGVAAIAAVPFSGMWGMAPGILLGYLLPSSMLFPARYAAALLAVAAARWALNDLVKLWMHLFFAPLISFAPVLTTGLTMTLVNGMDAADIAMYVAKSMLVAGVSYFLVRAGTLLLKGAGLNAMKSQDLACMMLSVGILILAFSSITLDGLPLGYVLAVLGILLAARYGGVTGGSVTGIGAGVILSLFTVGVSYLPGVYALGKPMTGVFSPLGRLVSAYVFVISNAMASLQVDSRESVLTGLYEATAASVIYIIWPEDVGSRLSAVSARPADLLYNEGLWRSVIMKLDYAAQALEGTSDSAEEASRKLDKFSAPDINAVYNRVIDDTCVRCGLHVYCWERNYDETMRMSGTLTQILRESRKITKDDFPKQFTDHCSHTTETVENIDRQYAEFLIREVAEWRVARIRGVVADQFDTTSQILKNMAEELELFERFDFIAARCVSDVMIRNGIIPIDVSCRVDCYDRMTIEAEAAQVDKSRLSKTDLTRRISQVRGRTFEMPCISSAQGECRMQMSERPVYRVQSGFFQHVSGSGQFCGDSQELSPDGSGRQIAIISDGMGIGGRAAVDGAMAAGIMTELIKAGIGSDCALKIVNSVLLAKSGNESLATPDVAAVDLFNGKVEFMKAGAIVSILRRDGRAVIIDTPSLPVGALTETKFARETVRLSSGDPLVLSSGGVVISGDDWMREAVTEWKGTVPQELVEQTVSQAIERRNNGHDDNITMLVLFLNELKKEL